MKNPHVRCKLKHVFIFVLLHVIVYQATGQDDNYWGNYNYGDYGGYYGNYSGGNYGPYNGSYGNYGPYNGSYGNYGPYNGSYGNYGPYNGSYGNYGPYNGSYGNYGMYNGSYGNYGPYNESYGNYGLNGTYYGNYSDYDVTNQEEECGGEITELTGAITSPGYPSAEDPQSTYPPNIDCLWYRDGTGSTLVQFKIWDMSIEIGENDSNVTCDFDFLNVSITSIGWKKFCGYMTPTEELVGIGTIDIHFHSDSSANFRGFTSSYTIKEDHFPCNPNPCHDGGFCSIKPGGIFAQCNCYDGYTGEQCEINIDECADDPCKNGGTCVDGDNRYTCTCPPFWTGYNCDTPLGVCDSQPCLNGGTCTVVSDTEYKCECEITHEGAHCETETGVVGAKTDKVEPETGCINPGIPYVEEGKRFDVNAVVQFSCADGYTLVGQSNLTCYENETWSDKMPDCIADEPGAEALEQSDGGVDAWTVAMVVLGLALFINIVIFGLWVAYKWPWMKVGQVTSMNNAMTASQAKLKQLQDAASISSISISSDETEDDDVTSESDASEIFENKFVRDVP